MRWTFLTTFRGMVLAAGLALIPGLAAAQACPDINLPAPPTPEVSADLTTGMRLQVVAGGAVNLGDCQTVPGNGFVEAAPDYELDVSGNTAADDLQFSVTAPCDSVLLVNDATGQWFFSDDEDGGSNPRIVVPGGPDGAYDIWVGSYDGATCNTTLTIQTFPVGTTAPTSAAAGSGLCPDASMEALLLSYSMTQLASPQMQQVVAGGDLDIGACSDVPGTGYVIQSPDFQMDLTGASGSQDVQVRADAQCDVVLLINDANGEWQYNDDTDGTNPVVTLTGAIDGAYDIWVGTLTPDTCQATLTISAAGGAAPPVKGQPPVSSAAADPGNLTAFRTNIGETMTFSVTGAIDGSVYGTDNYTDDSDLSTAAVHAGILAVGQTGDVTVQMTGPGKGYAASTRNGVDSIAYGKWDGSYAFVR